MKGRIPLGADQVGDGAGNPLAGAFTLFDRVADIVVPLIDETPLEDRLESGIRDALNATRPLFGPDEIAEGFELFPEKTIDLNDGVAETVSTTVPEGPFLYNYGGLEIGGTFGFRSEWFSAVNNLNVDKDADDNDLVQILNEILTGRSGANLDFEAEPGIENVALIDVKPNSYTLEFDGLATDVWTFKGPGVIHALGEVVTTARLGDDANSIDFVNFVGLGADDFFFADGPLNPVADLASGVVDSISDAADLVAAAAGSDERVDLLSAGDEYVSIRVNDAAQDVFDILVFEGVSLADFGVSDPGLVPA
jgi:hypothetical protein